MTQTLMFPDTPVVSFFDPLGKLLGAGDGLYTYTFDDAAKLAGHACPTVAGGFLLVKRAVELLYGNELPQRGDIRVTVYGAPDQGTTGPMSQVVTLLTGATADNGFQGLGRQFIRQGLMQFAPGNVMGAARYRFERVSTGSQVTLSYDPSSIPPAPTMGPDLQAVLSGGGSEETATRFRDAWRDRVIKILRDEGKNTIQVV
ncbi:MAG: hypothetical protein GY731_09815 [Gammaproteobacteria bacterium]|nr:hypothetical protein [Gammaproteobacteria bacterium]